MCTPTMALEYGEVEQGWAVIQARQQLNEGAGGRHVQGRLQHAQRTAAHDRAEPMSTAVGLTAMLQLAGSVAARPAAVSCPAAALAGAACAGPLQCLCAHRQLLVLAAALPGGASCKVLSACLPASSTPLAGKHCG